MKLQIITTVPEAQVVVNSLGDTHPMLGEVRMHVFRGYSLLVLRERGRALSLNVARFGKRAPRTVNVAVLYTPQKYRGRGYALELLRLAEEEGRRRGCSRLKSSAGAEGGLSVFARRGDVLRGVTDKPEVLVEYSLHGERSEVGALSLKQIRKLLNGRPLCYEHPSSKAE